MFIRESVQRRKIVGRFLCVRKGFYMSEKTEVVQVDLENIKEFPNHPFIVRNDELMNQLADSIRQVGVLVPAIMRPIDAGSYQLIAGHRRKQACEQLGMNSMPVIVREMDEDTATIMMVDSNLQREKILPSEKARAYKMKLEAIKHQGKRNDIASDQVEQKLLDETSDQVGQKLSDMTSDQVGQKLFEVTSDQIEQKLVGMTSRELIAANSPDSAAQIQRYIRLNELIPELLQMVDEGRIAMTPAVELSYLSKEEQELLLVTIDSEQATPSLSQAQRMKKLSRESTLTDDQILEIMMEQKKPDSWNLSLPMKELSKFFPSSYTPQQMQNIIFQLLDSWNKNTGR